MSAALIETEYFPSSWPIYPRNFMRVGHRGYGGMNGMRWMKVNKEWMLINQLLLEIINRFFLVSNNYNAVNMGLYEEYITVI